MTLAQSIFEAEDRILKAAFNGMRLDEAHKGYNYHQLQKTIDADPGRKRTVDPSEPRHAVRRVVAALLASGGGGGGVDR